MDYTDLQVASRTDIDHTTLVNGRVRHDVLRPRSQRKTYASVPIATSENFILKELPAKYFETLRPSLRRLSVTKEQFLLQQDDPIEYVYFPETAVISEFRMLDDGRMVEVALTGREGVIGLPTLEPRSRTPNCIQVSQPGTVLRIETSILQNLARTEPDLIIRLYAYIENYIRQMSSKAACNMYHSVEERFCTWLLMLHDRSGENRLRLTHEQISRTLGVYRSCVTLVAIDMRKKMMIDYLRGAIIIRNRALIQESACSCYSEMAGM